MGINQERFIQYYIQELLTHLQNENLELRNKVQHYQEVVNQQVTQDYLHHRLSTMSHLTKQAQSYIILTQKLKHRTNSFISQNLDQQISNVEEISKICCNYTCQQSKQLSRIDKNFLRKYHQMMYVDNNQIEREGYIARHYLGDRGAIGKSADPNN